MHVFPNPVTNYELQLLLTNSALDFYLLQLDANYSMFVFIGQLGWLKRSQSVLTYVFYITIVIMQNMRTQLHMF